MNQKVKTKNSFKNVSKDQRVALIPADKKQIFIAVTLAEHNLPQKSEDAFKNKIIMDIHNLENAAQDFLTQNMDILFKNEEDTSEKAALKSAVNAYLHDPKYYASRIAFEKAKQDIVNLNITLPEVGQNLNSDLEKVIYALIDKKCLERKTPLQNNLSTTDKTPSI